MGKEKKEKSRQLKVKKETWLSEQVKKFEAERGENLTETDKDSCLGNLCCLHSIRNLQVFPRRAETALRLKKKVGIKIAVHQNGTKGLSRVTVPRLQDTNLKNCMGELRFSKLISAMASNLMRVGKLLIGKHNSFICALRFNIRLIRSKKHSNCRAPISLRLDKLKLLSVAIS